MFSPSASFQTKLIEFSFIAGIDKEDIIKDNYKKAYIPKCLFGYPEHEDIFSQVAELVYPLDAYILPESEEGSMSFFTTMLTDAKANRTYIYVLKMFDMIDNMKIPIAICFGSKINDTEAFKKLLNEIYMIKTSDYSISTKQIELINYLMFVHSLLIPPSHTLMTLNMRYMSVDFYFHSKCELPCNLNDTNINILFSVLDVSKIIKLWLNVLRERKVIIYGNKPYLLNAICDAITRLIFPFKWQQTYITCLCKSQLDLLDYPCPALFGVLSSTININDLKEKYSGYCIVDLETGHILGQKIGKLPREVEILLRKKIQIIKNPELFEEDDLFKSEKNTKEIKESINSNLTFSLNMQKIFFEIIKENLVNYQDYVDSNNTLEEKRFLITIQSPEIRTLWEKLVKTLMFDCFIQLNKCKDDCYNRIFDELCIEDKTNQRNASNCLKLEITMPLLKSKNLMKILENIGFEDEELARMLTQYNCETKKTDFILSARKLSTSSLSPCQPNLIRNIIQIGEDENNSCDSFDNEMDFELIDSGISPLMDIKENNKLNNKPCKLMFKQEHEFKNLAIVSSPLNPLFKENHYINSVSNVSEKGLNFYSANGFIPFIKRIINAFNGKKYGLIDVLFKKRFLEEIIESSSLLDDSLNNINNIPEEKEGEDIDMKTPTIQKSTPLFQNQSQSKSKLKSSFIYGIGTGIGLNNGDSKDSGKTIKTINDNKQIIKMINTQSNLCQKYLLYAFYLEEISKYPDKTFQLSTNDIINYITTFYHKAIINDQREFPYYRYSIIINKCTQDQLKLFESNPELSGVKDIIQEALSNLFKKLRSFQNNSKKVFIESPRVNKNKLHFYSPALTPRYLRHTSPFYKTQDNFKSSGIGKLSLRDSSICHSKSLLESDGESSDNTFVILAKQMKREIKEMRNSKRKCQIEEQLNDTIIQNKEIKDVVKFIPIDYCVSEFSIKDTHLGIEHNFSTPLTLNKQRKISKSSEPLSLMVEIGMKIISFLDKSKPKTSFDTNSTSIDDKSNELLRVDFNQIQDLINRLQRVNLAKIAKTADQYSFWLNAFNFLLIYAILYTNYQPKTFDQWGLLMSNCLYKIGGYEMSLYEIENKILSCCNFHNKSIKFTDSITAKFCIVEDNILIDFALFLPIKDKNFHLTVYLNDKFEEQLYQTAKIFLSKNITYKKEDKLLTVTSYFNQIMPLFIEKTFIHYKNHIDSTVYFALENKEYEKKVILDTSWEYALY